MAGADHAILRPADADDLCEALGAAAVEGACVEARGGGTLGAVGAPYRPRRVLDMSAFTGEAEYDPPELVLSVGAATPLSEVLALVAGRGQMLAFEPFDYAPLFGGRPGAATVGGAVMAGIAGSRRLTAGSARDHLLGFEGVTGAGEFVRGGAKVVKNVTGYDLPKLIAGSWGRLLVATRLTLKVLPAPRDRATVEVLGLADAEAAALMSAALGSQAEVAAAAHLPGDEAGPGRTLLRVEGFGPSLGPRTDVLMALADGRPRRVLEPEAADGLWTTVREAAPLAGAETLWRASLPPMSGWRLVEGLAPCAPRALYDWAGGLVWLGLPAAADPARVRSLAEALGGRAMLLRAPVEVRAAVPALHPEAAAVAALSARVKAAFDPLGVLDPDRFKAAAHAD